MAKKVRIKKRNVGIAGGVLVVIIVLIIGLVKWKEKLDYQATSEYKLLSIGYSEEDTTFLIENLDKQHLNNIIENRELNEDIIKFYKQEYFLEKNLDEYLNYVKENPGTSYTDVVAIINVGANKDWYDGSKSTDITKGSALLVNKFHSLDSDYQPNLVPIKNTYAYANAKEMDEDAYYAFISMFNAAQEDGFKLVMNYSYRNYQEQEETYNNFKSQYGTEYADGYAARPGHSEHQTGLAFDLIIDSDYDKTNFDTSPKFAWLQENAYKYGYILRYPKDKEHLTGYSYEPWHYRYVGVEIATYIHQHNITYDEYYAYFLEG